MPSFESSPCSSPTPQQAQAGVSPTVSMNRLSCLSPLPDQRRDSSGEDFFFNLPVPKQFADSRRSSGVPERIPEMEETSVSLELPKGNTLLVPTIKDIERCASEQRPPFLAKFEAEKPSTPPDECLPQVVVETAPNLLVGETINIIDTDQPVSLGSGEGLANGRSILMLVSVSRRKRPRTSWPAISFQP